MHWLEVAQALPQGSSTRFQHECGEDKAAKASHSHVGYSAWCFRCGDLGFEGHGTRTLEQLKQQADMLAAQKEITHELPKDFCKDIPRIGLIWLWAAGISTVRAASCGFGWSARLRRVVMPIYTAQGELSYWQARKVEAGPGPKYINSRTPKNGTLGSYHPTSGPTAGCVVTEDLLSAVRIGRHCTAHCILGTKFSDQQCSRMGQHSSIKIWLDGDKAGIDGAAAGLRKLALIVPETSIISTDEDPKCYADREILRILALPSRPLKYGVQVV